MGNGWMDGWNIIIIILNLRYCNNCKRLCLCHIGCRCKCWTIRQRETGCRCPCCTPAAGLCTTCQTVVQYRQLCHCWLVWLVQPRQQTTTDTAGKGGQDRTGPLLLIIPSLVCSLDQSSELISLLTSDLDKMGCHGHSLESASGHLVCWPYLHLHNIKPGDSYTGAGFWCLVFH